MILRNIAIRHGRGALAPPISRSFLRTLTTNSSNTPDLASIEGSIESYAEQAQSISSSLAQFQSDIPATSTIPPAKTDAVSIAAQFAFTQKNKHTIGQLGSVLSKDQYRPHELVLNPPKPEDVTLELLMASQAHMGHATALWNPANQRYIYGIRQGIHIISLEATAAHLRRAAKVVEGVAYHGGLILFVGTRPGQSPAIVRAAQLAKGCHLFERWTPGSITNGEQILRKCGLKVLDPLDKELEGFEEKINDWKALKPDLVVVMNPLENYVLLQECSTYNIPTVGIIDTDADPTWVTYPIPANDDSLRCVEVITGVLGRAGEEGQKKRLEAAKTGHVTWLPPDGLGKPHDEAAEQRKRERNQERALDAAQSGRNAKSKQRTKEIEAPTLDDGYY